MITLDHAYILVGLMFGAFAVLTLGDRTHPTRIRSAVFWGLIAASMLFGSWLGGLGNGILVLALVAVGGLKKLGVGHPPTTTLAERREGALRRGNALFIPALIVPLVAVVVYCLGMALFTVIMGNAFAAFPVMTAAIGLPFVVVQFGGNPAIVCAIGMLAGFCGTLMTPMAANFNVVPANLLELPDRDAALNGVIRAQLPTALILLGINIALMYALAFRF